MSNEEKRTVEMEVSHLKKYYKAGWHSVLKAVDDVSFRIYKGETLGLVGDRDVERRLVERPALECWIKQMGRFCIRERTFILCQRKNILPLRKRFR